MPLIKPRTRGKHFARLQVRLERENHETLHAYAAFIGETAEYVVNEAIETVLARDREFATWRREHPGSYAPLPPAAATRAAVAGPRADGRETDGRTPPRLG